VPLIEVGDRVTPLAGAVVVPDQLARRDQVAASPGDAHEQLRRLGKPDGEGLVEQPHPGGVVTLVHKGDSPGWPGRGPQAR
jgi:hypothetical protein